MTKEEVRPKLVTIEAGRGVAAAIVVAYHAIELVTRAGFGQPVGVFKFGYAGVDFFFVLSGFLIYYMHRKDLGRPEKLGNYLRKRFCRIYPVYWLVMSALIAAMLAAPSITDPYKRSIGFVSQSLLLLPQEQPPLLGVSWSLCYEQLFYVLFGLAILHRGLGAAAGMCLAGLGTLGLFADAPFPWSFFCNPRILEFLMGISAAEAVLRTRTWRHAGRGALLGILLFASVGMMDAFLWKLSVRGAVIGYGLSSTLFVYSAACLEKKWLVPVPRFLAIAGAASYSIYLVHWPAILVFTGILKRLPINSNVAWLASTLCGIAAGVCFHAVVERPLLALLGRGRSPSTESAHPSSTLAPAT